MVKIQCSWKIHYSIVFFTNPFVLVTIKIHDLSVVSRNSLCCTLQNGKALHMWSDSEKDWFLQRECSWVPQIIFANHQPRSCLSTLGWYKGLPIWFLLLHVTALFASMLQIYGCSLFIFYVGWLTVFRVNNKANAVARYFNNFAITWFENILQALCSSKLHSRFL